MTKLQRDIIANMDDKTLMENYKYFLLKVHNEFEFQHIEKLDACHEEIMKRMAK